MQPEDPDDDFDDPAHEDARLSDPGDGSIEQLDEAASLDHALEENEPMHGDVDASLDEHLATREHEFHDDDLVEPFLTRAEFADAIAASPAGEHPAANDGPEFVDAEPSALDAAAGIAQVDSPAGQDVAGHEVERRHLRGLLEALLFVSDRPMKAADLASVARAETREVRLVLEALVVEYEQDARGFRLDELAGGFQFRTSHAFAPFVRELTQQKPVRLTRAQVETLAIIAYRQPITRPEVDEIRGVDAGAVLKLLLDRDLIRVLGKKDEPGRPLLYGTTSNFLAFFGLKSLRDLPTLREFTELTEESQEVVERELGEVLPDGPREPVPSIVGDSSVAGVEDMPAEASQVADESRHLVDEATRLVDDAAEKVEGARIKHEDPEEDVEDERDAEDEAPEADEADEP